jgi:hypothetical protein
MYGILPKGQGRAFIPTFAAFCGSCKGFPWQSLTRASRFYEPETKSLVSINIGCKTIQFLLPLHRQYQPISTNPNRPD